MEEEHEINTKKNKERFIRQLEFQLDEIKDMPNHCFKNVGFYVNWESENGQFGTADWYVGTGTTGPPPGPG